MVSFSPRALYALATLFSFSSISWALDPKCPSGMYEPIPQMVYGLNCGTLGRLTKPQVISSVRKIDNLQHCAVKCKTSSASPRCISVGYSPKNSTCVLYSARLDDQGYVERKTQMGTTFANMKCYRCVPLVCSNTEAVTNGGFEVADPNDPNGAADWSLGDDHGIQISRQVVNGNAVISAYLTGNDDVFRLTQTIGCVNPHLPYKLSFNFEYDEDGLYPLSLGAELDGVQVFKTVDPRFGHNSIATATATVTLANQTPTLVISAYKAALSGDPAGLTFDNVSLQLITGARGSSLPKRRSGEAPIRV